MPKIFDQPLSLKRLEVILPRLVFVVLLLEIIACLLMTYTCPIPFPLDSWDKIVRFLPVSLFFSLPIGGTALVGYLLILMSFRRNAPPNRWKEIPLAAGIVIPAAGGLILTNLMVLKMEPNPLFEKMGGTLAACLMLASLILIGVEVLLILFVLILAARKKSLPEWLENAIVVVFSFLLTYGVTGLVTFSPLAN
jgi:uncharacterized membrane protein